MTLDTNKQTDDPIFPAEWNEAATAANKVTDQTLVVADISDFATGISGKVDKAGDTMTGDLALGNNSVTGLKEATFNGVYANGNSGASLTVDFTNGSIQSLTLDQNSTFTFTNPSGVSRLQLIISGGASFTITWPTITWLTTGGTAPTLDGTDVVTLIFDGTNYYGTLSNQS